MKVILVLSPHSDDAELGMGGTMARFADEGAIVHNAIFSFCGCQHLRLEARDAGIVLRHQVIGSDYPVRQFSECRQEILDYMLNLKKQINPDLVFMPSCDDVHQDHQVIALEARRAFKFNTLFGYELPWNTRSFATMAFSHLNYSQIKKKIDAIACYKSQEHRPYAKESIIESQALVRGMQCNTDYAEAFEVIRINI